LVEPRKVTSLGNLLWNVNSNRKRIFQVGALDHKTLGFHNGGAPYEHGLVADSPANLTYTIGTSNESDWYFGQSALGSWAIVFNIPEEDAALNKTAILSLSLAGYSKSSDLNVSINGQLLTSLITADLASDPGLYRSATTAGEWRFFEFTIGNSLLTGGSNELVFEITRYTQWRGFMWDSVVLDWAL